MMQLQNTNIYRYITFNMGILNKILSSQISDVVTSVGNVVDKLHTSAEEKELAKREMRKLLQDYDKSIQQEVTARWNADMNSDSWLSKNIRPLVLGWLVAWTTVLIFIDAGAISFNVEEKWVDLLQLVLITVIGAYFGSRGLEKVKNGK